MAKIINFDVEVHDHLGNVLNGKAFEYVKLVLSTQASTKEGDFLKSFALVQKIDKKPSAVELDEGDESTVRKAIESFNQIDALGSPRVNAYVKAQLTLAINNAKEKK